MARHIIWCKNLETGYAKLEDIKRKYELYAIALLVKEKTDKYCHDTLFDNGDFWGVRIAKDVWCGIRCHHAYILEADEISPEILKNVIYPSVFEDINQSQPFEYF